MDFLTKKMKVNEGEVPQYYVENSHPAIILPDEFDEIQAEMMNRKKAGKRRSCVSPFSGRLVCGDCGEYYTPKVWHSTDKYRRVIWQCGAKYKHEQFCRTPHLYEANATGKLPDKHFTRLLAEYDEEQTGLKADISEWQGQLDTWNADRLNTDKFIELASRYTDFTELTTPMLNEFVEKVIVHEGEGRGNSRRQRIDIYLNFIGAFEVPAEVVTPTELEAERRTQEERAAHEQQLKEAAQERYEQRKQEKRDFTARKKAGLLTPEEIEADELRRAKSRAWQKEWRDKRKAAEPEKPPKHRTLKEIAALKREGAELTPEEAQRLTDYRSRKNAQFKKWRDRKAAEKAAQDEKGEKIA